MTFRRCLTIAFLSLLVEAALGDSLLYRYEGDVPPNHESAGWIVGDSCEGQCSDNVENGSYVLSWPDVPDIVSYLYWIGQPPDPPPQPLWAEWRFRSNHPKPSHSDSCDGWFTVHSGETYEVVFMYGDAAISFSGDHVLSGLAIDAFHTYRFESVDGENYWVSGNGLVFLESWGNDANGYHFLTFGGQGGCIGDQIPDNVNAWDFIRYGTISYGEQIIASDPPAGFLNARQHAGLDRFTVTFDEPNYVYLDEITVEVTGGVTPQVTQTRRRDNGEPDTVEIVLDRPIAFGETTRFTFDDGVAISVVEYTFAPGDTDGDGDTDLHDFALFQTCFGQSNLTAPCAALDLDASGRINLSDYALFHDIVFSQ